MAETLLPCPFCGCTDIAPLSRNNGHVDLVFLVCNTCEAEGPCSALGGTAKAIERWNRRATPPEDNRLREALEKIIERSENGELGSSKVRDMAAIARTAVSRATKGGEDDQG